MLRSASTHEERVAFCVTAPVGRAGEADFRSLLGAFTRGVEGELDLSDPATGARLVAAVVEKPDNAINAADLVPLGLSGPPSAWPSLLGRAVAAAKALARTGPRERLRVPLVERLSGLGPWLEATGFTIDHLTYEMLTRDATVRAVEPPAGARFVDWAAASCAVEVVDRMVRRAFAGDCSVSFLPPEQLRHRLASASPAPRLLFVGDLLAGLVRLRAPGPDGVGYVHLLARDPAFRGRGIGDVLVSEAKARLRDVGADRFALDVTATNRSALSLYERHGFEVHTVETAWLGSLDAPLER